jgi:hypothetical protein
MKRIIWSPEKARALMADPSRGNVGFEECVVAIEDGRVLADIANPAERYPGQRMLVLNINNYAYVVPYVEDSETIFLKTVFPSRKHTALYMTD